MSIVETDEFLFFLQLYGMNSEWLLGFSGGGGVAVREIYQFPTVLRIVKASNRQFLWRNTNKESFQAGLAPLAEALIIGQHSRSPLNKMKEQNRTSCLKQSSHSE